MSIKLSIIIPNWNGRAYLTRCVAAVLQSAAEYGHSFECLLMDDASTDGSAQETHQQFPDIRLITHESNRGFGHMVNEGAKQAQGKIIVLVNNDLIARPGFIGNLCRHFDNAADIFGVSGKTVDWDNGEPNHLNMRGFMEDGKLRLTWSDDAETTETMFLQGGSCAVLREKFLDFGGFHPLFAPGYWEDYDISYQALKAGYRNLYDPTALGSHLGQGSMIRAHGEERINQIRMRNSWLMLAMNLTDYEASQALWGAMPGFVAKGENLRFKSRLAIFHYIFVHRAQILKERQARFQRQRLSDAEVFERFKGLGEPC